MLQNCHRASLRSTAFVSRRRFLCCPPPASRPFATMSASPAQVGSYARTLGPIDLHAAFAKDDAHATRSKPPAASTLTRWTSQSSGLQVVHIDFPSPVVSLYACVRTEILNDFGIPHTLEHAVFLGSEQYPYKGVCVPSLRLWQLLMRGEDWTPWPIEPSRQGPTHGPTRQTPPTP
jgi:hypothetical protein